MLITRMHHFPTLISHTVPEATNDFTRKYAAINERTTTIAVERHVIYWFGLYRQRQMAVFVNAPGSLIWYDVEDNSMADTRLNEELHVWRRRYENDPDYAAKMGGPDNVGTSL